MLSKRQEFGRGWAVLVASGVGGATGVAVLSAYSLGAFVGPLGHQFGWTRAQVTAAALFSSLGYLAAGWGTGMLADRFGARLVAIFSQTLLVMALGAMAVLPPNLALFYAGYFVISVAGAGTLPMTWSRAIVGWFAAARGLALGVSLVGTGLVGGLLPAFVSALIAHWGWRSGFLGLAALPLLLGLPLSLAFFREPPVVAPGGPVGSPSPPGSEAEDGASFREAAATLSYWGMCLAFFLAAIGVSAVLVHALPLLIDHGFSPAAAAVIAGVFGLAVAGGRLVSGYLLDTIRAPKVALSIFSLAGIACGVLALSGANRLLCAVAVAVVGLAAGAEADIAGYLTASYFGRRNFGAIYGMLYALYCLGSGIGPMIAGAVFDATRSYQAALWAGVVLFLVAAILTGALRTPRARQAGTVARTAIRTP